MSHSDSGILGNAKALGMAAAVGLVAVLFGLALLISPLLIVAGIFYLAAIFLLQNRLRELFYAYLFGIFFIPPTISIDTPLILLNADRMILAVLWGAWAVRWIRGKARFSPTFLGTGIALYLLSILASIVMNYGYISGQGLTSSSGLKVFAFFVERVFLIFLLPSVVKDRKDIQNILTFSVLCLMVVAAYGIIESITHYNIFTKFTTVNRAPLNNPALSMNIRAGMYRAKSTQLLPHAFGTILSMTFPLLVYTFFNQKGKKRLVTAAVALIFAGGVAFSYTRGVYLAFGVGCALSFLLIRSTVKKMILILLMLAALGAASVHPAIRVFYSEYLGRLLNPRLMASDRENSMQARLSDYEYTAQQLERQPLLGRGFGTHQAGKSGMPYLDNAYLYILIETGILGFLSFLVLLIGILFRLGHRIRSQLATDPFAVPMQYLHIGVIIFFFQGLTYDAFGMGGSSKFVWVMVGLLMAYLQLPKASGTVSGSNVSHSNRV